MIDPLTIGAVIIIGLMVWGVVSVAINASHTIAGHQKIYTEWQKLTYPETHYPLLLAESARSRKPAPSAKILDEMKEEEQKPEPREERDLGTVPLDELEAINPKTYCEAIVTIRYKVIEQYNYLFDRDGSAKIIRDMSKSGYPGCVASASAPEEEKQAKITRAQWDHCYAKDGIFWQAECLTYSEEGDVIYHEDEKERLATWLEERGHVIKIDHVEEYE